MIWLLSNAWWLVPVAIGLLALVHPATLVIIRRVPARAWAVIGAAALLGAAFQSGRFYERSVQREADKTLDAKAGVAVKQSKGRAEKARRDITKGTADVVAQVRTEIRYLPATCPALPNSVRESVQRQVQAARDGVQEPARNRNR